MKQAFLFLSLFLVSDTLGQDVRQAPVAGRRIELQLVKADDLSPVAWPNISLELKVSKAISAANQNIYMMLRAHGIAPDSEAFTLVYDLNPQINDLGGITSGTVIAIPDVTGDPRLHQLLNEGDVVELTLDPDIRKQLSQNINSLQTFVESVNQLSTEPSTQIKLKKLLNWYAEIEKRFKRRTEPPLRQSTLLQMLDESKMLLETLENSSGHKRGLTKEEQHQISAMYEDLKIEMARYGQTLGEVTPRAQVLYMVTVNIKGIDPKRVVDVRIYYTYNGLFRSLPAQPPITSFGFTRLGSGQSENLLAKNYQIWAAKDGDPNHPMTSPYLLRIDSSSNAAVTVDLMPAAGLR